MLEIKKDLAREYEKKIIEAEKIKIPDIIVTKYRTETKREKDGTIIIKRIEEKTNITKKINETAKILKELTAEEKIKEIEKELGEIE